MKVDVLQPIVDYKGEQLKASDTGELLNFRGVATMALGFDMAGAEGKARGHVLSVKLWAAKESGGKAEVDLTPSEAALIVKLAGEHPGIPPVVFGRIAEHVGELPEPEKN